MMSSVKLNGLADLLLVVGSDSSSGLELRKVSSSRPKYHTTTTSTTSVTSAAKDIPKSKSAQTLPSITPRSHRFQRGSGKSHSETFDVVADSEGLPAPLQLLSSSDSLEYDLAAKVTDSDCDYNAQV